MRRWGHAGGSTGYVPPVAPITVSSVWAGNISEDAAQVKARITDSAVATLRFDTDPGIAHPTLVSGSEGNDDVFTFDLPDLTANQDYYYGFAGSDEAGQFRTFPAEGDPASFAIWAASCAGHSGGEYVTNDTSDSRAFDVIAAKLLSGELIGGIHMGDRGYPDVGSNSVSLVRANYNENMLRARQLALHRTGWMAYKWDDHDFGPNDSHAGSAAKPASQSVYREHVPHWTLPVADSIQQTFVIGRVRFILTDSRSYRSTNGSTDNSSKTMLGATQKAWLKATVAAATEPLIVWDSGSPWNGNDSITWGVFSTERDELIADFTAEGQLGKLLIMHGDNHFLAGDDGTNAPGGIPTFNLGPMDAGFTTNDGTWTTGIFKSEQQQYGTLHFDDDGSEIVVTVRGYSVNSSGVETERFEVVLPAF